MNLKLRYSKYELECGTDEAGRGCLAGPVTAAAVILPDSYSDQVLNDSKLLSAKKRNVLKQIIEEKSVCFSVSHTFPETIDNINILNASILAMHNSIKTLHTTPQFVIVDGNRFKQIGEIPYSTIIKGDSKYLSIAAASVLAKTYRDEFMERLHLEFPVYNWKQNKGYPTREHREAIRKFGITKYHRKSFRLLPEQYQMDL